MMDIKGDFLQCFIKFLIKSLKVVVLIFKLKKITNLLMNFINQILKSLKEDEYIHHLKTIFGVLILQICN